MSNLRSRNWYFGFSLAAALWLLAHSYLGIRHDGILYLGQALYNLQPAIFGHDVFFAHGSQDSYSIFAKLYALAIHRFGLPGTELTLVILAQAAFVATACWLIFELGGAATLAYSLVLIATSPFYGGWNIFSFGEPFVTARSFAEPAILAGLALMLRQQRWAALPLLGLGLALHPLMALPGFALWWIDQARLNPRWWWLGASALLLPIFAVMGIHPFDGLLQSYDTEWLELVIRRTPFVFPLHWAPKDWAIVAFDLMALIMALAFAEGRQRRFLEAVLLAGAGGVLLGAIGGDLLDNVLLTGLQLWRSHWILHLVALALLPGLAIRLWQAGGSQRIALLFLAMGLLFARYPGGLAASIGAGLVFICGLRNVALSRSVLRLVYGVAVIGFILTLLNEIDIARAFSDSLYDDNLAKLIGHTYLSPAPALATLALVHAVFRSRKFAFAAPVVTIVLIVFAVTTWDWRDEWKKDEDSMSANQHPFTRFIPPDAQVYWHKDLLAPWLMLRRASYYAIGQGSGVLFNRGTAIDLERRYRVIALLEMQETSCQLFNALNSTDTCQPDEMLLREICRNDPAPDFLVLESSIPELALSEWGYRRRNGKERKFYLYSCQTIAGKSAPKTPGMS